MEVSWKAGDRGEGGCWATKCVLVFGMAWVESELEGRGRRGRGLLGYNICVEFFSHQIWKDLVKMHFSSLILIIFFSSPN